MTSEVIAIGPLAVDAGVMDTHTVPATHARPGATSASRARIVPDATARLRRALRANATTSIAAGLVLAIAAGWVDGLLGTGHPGWVRLVGIGVLLFGVDIAILSRARERYLARWTPVVVAADVTWVVASVVTILLGWFSVGGALLVAAMAAAVDTFAVLQFRAWRQMTSR